MVCTSCAWVWQRVTPASILGRVAPHTVHCFHSLAEISLPAVVHFSTGVLVQRRRSTSIIPAAQTRHLNHATQRFTATFWERCLFIVPEYDSLLFVNIIIYHRLFIPSGDSLSCQVTFSRVIFHPFHQLRHLSPHLRQALQPQLGGASHQRLRASSRIEASSQRRRHAPPSFSPFFARELPFLHPQVHHVFIIFTRLPNLLAHGTSLWFLDSWTHWTLHLIFIVLHLFIRHFRKHAHLYILFRIYIAFIHIPSI